MVDATTQVKVEELNLAEMSDDEINNLDPSRLEGASEEPQPETEEEQDPSAIETTEDDTADEETDGAALSDDSPTEDIEGADSTSAELVADTGTDDQTPEPQEDTPAASQAAEQVATDSEEPEPTTSEVNYKAEFARLMAPFKAAKREIKVDNIEDARRLMQMGVDYSRKMEAMKPYQRVLQTLEKNDLLDVGRLNFLIDLDKKNPEAIKKFLKDSKIDPMDLSLEEGTDDYKPNDHMVGEQEVVLNEVLEDIRHTDTFDRTAQVISKDWDTASRQVLYEDPRIIRALNDNIQSGVFDQISNVVANERVLGRLVGLSDLEAYKTVGDAIQARNGFVKPTSDNEPSSDGTTPQPSQNSGSESAKADKLRNRRRAASSPKGAASAGKVKVDLAKLSDDEIEKMDYTTL